MKQIKFLSMLISLLCIFNWSQAASISQTKNGKVVIVLDGAKVSVGQMLTFKDGSGAVAATAAITWIGNQKALAVIKSGKLAGDESVVIESKVVDMPDAPKTMPDDMDDDKAAAKKWTMEGMKVSGVLNYAIGNMEAKVLTAPNTTEGLKFSGNGVGLTGVVDYGILSWLDFRGTIGYEPFVVKSTKTVSQCNSSTGDCDANINYLSLAGYARFNLTEGPWQTWAAVGATYKYPISKKSTALTEGDIVGTYTWAGALGVDYWLNGDSFVPFSVEYQNFPSTSEAFANMTIIRIGYGMKF